MDDRLDEIRERANRAGVNDNMQRDCRCGESPHENALHDLAVDDVPWLIAEIDRLRAELDQSRTYRITEGVDRG